MSQYYCQTPDTKTVQCTHVWVLLPDTQYQGGTLYTCLSITARPPVPGMHNVRMSKYYCQAPSTRGAHRTHNQYYCQKPSTRGAHSTHAWVLLPGSQYQGCTLYTCLSIIARHAVSEVHTAHMSQYYCQIPSTRGAHYTHLSSIARPPVPGVHTVQMISIITRPLVRWVHTVHMLSINARHPVPEVHTVHMSQYYCQTQCTRGTHCTHVQCYCNTPSTRGAHCTHVWVVLPEPK